MPSLSSSLIGPLRGPDSGWPNLAARRSPCRWCFSSRSGTRPGNSFAYFNGGVEKQVAALAAAEEFPREIDVDASTEPGATLKGHWLGSEPDYLDGAVDEIREGDHEVVVLQGDIPMLFERDVAPFLEYARLFDREIKDAGAATVFFMTWPYERVDWHERSDWIDLDGIVEAHRQVEAELDAKVAPVGVAMEKALAERPDLAMLGADREHELSLIHI